MSLPTAQLGQLPSMNLSGGGSKTFVEPAWHKALAAFLVNAAAGAASGATSNALSRDVTPQAVTAGVAPAGQTAPTFWDQVVHGPAWTQKSLDEAMRTKQQGQAYAQTAAYEQGMLKNDQTRTTNESAHQKANEDLEAKKLGMTADEYKAARTDREYNNLMQSQDRRDSMMEKSREFNAEAPGREAVTGLHKANTQHVTLENDPAWQGKVKAQQMLEMMRAMGIDPSKFGGQQGAGNPMNPTQPPDNSATVDFHGQMAQPTVHGPTSGPFDYQNFPSSFMPPTAQTPPVQPSGPHEVLSAREAANRAPAAGTSTQAGQFAPMQAAPPPPSANNPPSTIPNQTRQFQGEPTTMLNMQAMPADPYGMTGNVPESSGNFIPPFQFDPEMLKRAAMLAKLLGQPQSIGGTPNAAGSGGTPIGYG